MKAEFRTNVFQFLWSLPRLRVFLFCHRALCVCFCMFSFFCHCAFVFVCFSFFVLVPCAAISVMDQSQTRGHWSSQWWKNRKQERQQKFNILQHLGQQWESITSITMLLLISILNKVILGHKVFWGEVKIYFLAKRGTARPLPLPEQTEAILPVDASFALSGYPLAQGKILFFSNVKYCEF